MLQNSRANKMWLTPLCIGLLKTSCMSDCDSQFSYRLKNVLTVCKSCRQNGINEYLKSSTRSSLQASMQPSSILSSSLSSFLVTCDHSTFVFMFFHFPSVSSSSHNILFSSNLSPCVFSSSC